MSDYTDSERYAELREKIDDAADEHGRGSDDYETAVEQLLLDALGVASFEIREHGHDELVIESELFVGRHSGELGRQAFFYDEFGIYTLRGTDDSTEFVGDYELIQEAQQRQREHQQEDHASLTPAERNPGLATSRRI